MRPHRVMHFAWLVAISGCSTMIAAGGSDLTDLKTRADAHKKLGNPQRSGEEKGQAYEEFTSRTKVARSPNYHFGQSMGMAFTLGLTEVVNVPVEVYRNSSRLLFGQRLRVHYDEDGNVTTVDVGSYDTVNPHNSTNPVSGYPMRPQSSEIANVSGVSNQ